MIIIPVTIFSLAIRVATYAQPPSAIAPTPSTAKTQTPSKNQAPKPPVQTASPKTVSDVKYFELGLAAAQQKKWSDAKTDFQNALEQKTLVAAELHEKLAEVEEQSGDMSGALQELERCLRGKPNATVSIDARFLMSEVELKLNKIGQALSNLRFLELHSRHSPRYPDVLVKLLEADIKENRRYLACRWARRIYARFPAQADVINWGVDLVEDKIGDQKVGCVPSQRDIETRMKRLQLAGHEDLAKREIDELRKRAAADGDKAEIMRADMLLVQYYELQGYPYEALQILVKYYDQKKDELRYQEELGRVAAQAGEFQSAIGAFNNAYHLSPWSSSGRKAAFNAAYLSYQIQDYDGAEQRFIELIKRNAGSKLAIEARWHIAWIEYLKQHYGKAEDLFRQLYQRRIVYVWWRRHRRHRRVRYPYRNERTHYWLAMTLFREKKYDEAREYFERLASASDLSFYGFLAKSRLKQIPSAKPEKASGSATSVLAKNDPAPDANSGDTSALDASSPDDAGPHLTSPADADAAANSPAADATEQSANSGPQLKAGKSDDSESADDSATNDSAVSEAATTDSTNTDSSAPDINGEVVQASSFKDPRLRQRFTRASELMTLGLADWAKGELFEIERRTRNRTYLNMLMSAYVRTGSFDRAMNIAQRPMFERERQKGGLSGAKSLWQFAFPPAYESTVAQYSRQFGVPKELVWAIMRAESRFNPNAISPVGARGLIQLMPYTAEQLERLLNQPPIQEEKLMTPQTNIELGARYLARLLHTFSGYTPLVAAAYNAGPHRVYSWLSTFGNLDMDEFVEHIPFVETRNYVKKVVRNYIVYSQLYDKNKKDLTGHGQAQWLISSIPVKIDRKPSPRENWESIE